MLKQKAVFRRDLNEALRVAYLFQAHLREGGGGWEIIWEGELSNLENTMVSVLHEELKYKVEELKNKKVGGHEAKDQNQIRTSSWYIRPIPDQSIWSLQLWLINTVSH